MQTKSSPPKQGAVAETWTADHLVLGQALYNWAILSPTKSSNILLKSFTTKLQLYSPILNLVALWTDEVKIQAASSINNNQTPELCQSIVDEK